MIEEVFEEGTNWRMTLMISMEATDRKAVKQAPTDAARTACTAQPA